MRKYDKHETLMYVNATGTSEMLTLAGQLLGRTQPHSQSLGGVQPELARLQQSLDVDKKCSETSYGCLSIPGRCAEC